MNRNDVPNNWLSSGGAYAVLGVVWILTAVFYYAYAQKLGRQYDSPNDGCLLGVGTIVLTLTGGAFGLLLFQFPTFIVTSCIGSVLLPGLGCIFFRHKMKNWHQGK